MHALLPKELVGPKFACWLAHSKSGSCRACAVVSFYIQFGPVGRWSCSRLAHAHPGNFTFKILLVGMSKKALFCIFYELMWDTAAVCDHQRDMAIHFDLQVSARNELWFVVEICEANLQPLQNFVPQRKLLSKYSES